MDPHCISLIIICMKIQERKSSHPTPKIDKQIPPTNLKSWGGRILYNTTATKFVATFILHSSTSQQYFNVDLGPSYRASSKGRSKLNSPMRKRDLATITVGVVPTRAPMSLLGICPFQNNQLI